MEVWLTGGTILTMNASGDILSDGAIQIIDGKITKIASDKNPKIPTGAKRIDCTGCLVLPGLVNGHTHIGMSLLRGAADDLPLRQWLETKIFPLEKKHLSPKFVRLGSQLAALEMIRNGTTLFNDMYHFEEETARVVHESGLRAICGLDMGLDTKPADIDRRFRAYLESVAGYPNVVPAMAPHSIYTCSHAVLKESVAVAEKCGARMHTHVSETQEEVTDSMKAHGISPVKYLESLGFWHQKIVAAHAVCLDDEDIAIFGKYGVGISHNIESNLKLGTGICRVPDLRRAGARLAFGTDGVVSNNDLDLLGEADTAVKLQSFARAPGAFTARDAVKVLTIEGARALGMDAEVGSLEVGKSGDVIAVSLEAPHLQPLYDPYSHLVFSAAAADVKHTVVRGRPLMENRQVDSLDQLKILHEVKTFVP